MKTPSTLRVRGLPVLQVAQHELLDHLAAGDLHRLVADELLDARRRPRLVHEDLIAVPGAAADHVHLLRDAAHLDRGLEGRVAAADDGDGLLPVERAVARGAVHNAPPGELVLAGDLQVALLGAAGDDHGPGLDLLAGGELEDLGAAVHADAGDALADEPLEPVHVGLLEHQPHQLGTLDDRHPGVVGHEVGDADLSAEVERDQDRREVLAGGVQRGREAGRSAAHHRDVPHAREVDRRLDAEQLVERRRSRSDTRGCRSRRPTARRGRTAARRAGRCARPSPSRPSSSSVTSITSYSMPLAPSSALAFAQYGHHSIEYICTRAIVASAFACVLTPA